MFSVDAMQYMCAVFNDKEPGLCTAIDIVINITAVFACAVNVALAEREKGREGIPYAIYRSLQAEPC